jgi:hypothetical protein
MSENSSVPAAAPAVPVSDSSAAAPVDGQQQVVATPAEIRKMKLKIDGVESEYGEDEVIRFAQQGKSANKKFQEAAQMKKESEELINLIKRDPRAVLEDPRIGHNFRKLAEDFLVAQIKEEMMTPEQKKHAEMEKQLRAFESEKKQQQQQQESAQMEQLKQHYANEYQTTITTALSQTGVPKTARTVKRMAELMSQSLANGIDLPPAQLAKIVKEDYLAEMKEMFGASDEDTLLGLLGDEVSNKIRRADLKKLKNAGNPQNSNRNVQKTAEKPQKKQGVDSFFADLKKRM